MTLAIVIGSGFSGAMTAVQLRARGIEAIVVGEGELGRGIAYADGPDALLLNTPASAMSALPDQPDDFVRWLGTGEVFARRREYGRYIAEKAAGMRQIFARAVDVVPWGPGYQVVCSDGQRLWGTDVVLALGNAPPHAPAIVRGFAAYWGDPARAMVEVPLRGPIALLGTGLTALDVVAALRARGYDGELVAISRRGVVPQRHPGVPATTRVAPPTQWTLAALIRWWRGSPDATAKLDAVRALVPRIWASWSAEERARFVRHVRPHWEAVRHRAPPAIHAHTQTLRQVRGGLRGAALVEGGLRLTVGAQPLDVAALINCTGPERDPARMRDPLVQRLLARGLLVRDPLGAAALAPHLHAVGPLRVATDYESTAVGELRHQAQEVSEHLGEAAPGALEQPGAVVGRY